MFSRKVIKNNFKALKNNFYFYSNNKFPVVFYHSIFDKTKNNRFTKSNNRLIGNIGNKYIFQRTSRKEYFKKTYFLNIPRNPNFYEVLGLEKNCTNEQIKQTYFKLAKLYHPDVNKDLGSDDRFKSITLAYEAIGDPKNRELYDACLVNDPALKEWNFWDEEENLSGKQREKYKRDSNTNTNYRNDNGSNFWREQREDFEEKFYNDYSNIFNNGYKPPPTPKGDDIIV